MSVEPLESMSDEWIRWEGHAINGAFPLHRYLGCSDHSGVFLSEFAARQLPEVAIKLMRVDPTRPDSRLPRLKTAAGLTHRHLLRLFEIGRCYLDGVPHLYAVMEYADQTLGQLLTHRALTEAEAREMLLPTLDALLFLHNRNLVQGQMKPPNVLVVGDQLKLASDTIIRVGEDTANSDVPLVYDPPEARHACRYTAGDIWGLGVTLVEALTRSPSAGCDEHEQEVGLPPDFSPVFRDIVTRCLSVRPSERPTVKELVAWLRAQSAGSGPTAPVQPALSSQPAVRMPAAESSQPAGVAEPTEVAEPGEGTEPADVAEPAEVTEGAGVAEPAGSAEPAESAEPAGTAEPAGSADPAHFEALEPNTAESVTRLLATLQQLVRDGVARAEPAPLYLLQYFKQRSLVPIALGALAIIALSWVGMRLLSSHRASAPPTMQIARDVPLQTASAATPVAPSPVVSAATTGSGSIVRGPAPAGMAATPIHEVIPDIPVRARRTIRGHIKVYIRVIVDKDGTVFAALPDRAGPSRYFERLAMQSAKKWSFPPVDAPDRRVMQVRFDFSRSGTTGRVVTLH